MVVHLEHGPLEDAAGEIFSTGCGSSSRALAVTLDGVEEDAPFEPRSRRRGRLSTCRCDLIRASHAGSRASLFGSSAAYLGEREWPLE